MTIESYIGWWARRAGQWHLVQSEITDRLVMGCGRQMRMQTQRGKLDFRLEPSAEKCKQCAPASSE